MWLFLWEQAWSSSTLPIPKNTTNQLGLPVKCGLSLYLSTKTVMLMLKGHGDEMWPAAELEYIGGGFYLA